MKSNKSKIALIMILGVIVILIPMLVFFVISTENNSQLIPLFGLQMKYHLTLFGVVIPHILMIIFVMVFPLLLAPLFLGIKKIFMRKYENVYVKTESDSLDLGEFFKRGFKVFLLTITILSLVFDSDLLNLEQWVSESTATNTPPELLMYNSEVSSQLIFLIEPIVIGILSIGWVIKDAGLMHYKLPSEESKGYFEIEPSYMRFNALIEGYSGISTVIFYVRFIINGGTRDLFFNLSMGIFVIFASGFAYYLYWKIIRPFMIKRLRKDLKEVEKMPEIKLKEETVESKN